MMTNSTRISLLGWSLAMGLLLAAAGPTAVRGSAAPPPEKAEAPSKRQAVAKQEAAIPWQRGVSWVGGPEPVTRGDFEPLAANHVDWIVQTPFGWQQRFDSPRVDLKTGGRILWGERDEGLATTGRLARERGIRTLLKPHVWLREKADGKWRKDIRMGSEEDWRRWFASYRELILHYARLAEGNGFEALAVGTELHRTAVEREADWRRLIAEVRAVYSGKLTYAANWWREFEEVRFWDDLDFIGIQGYFPLVDGERPTEEALLQGWREHLPAIEAVSRRFGKPVVFTELGYKSTADGATTPWEWPDLRKRNATEADPVTQARAYEAFFRTFWDRPWFAGVYFWKWYPSHERAGGPRSIDFTPQNKPAQEVMARWYQKARAEEAR